MLKTISKALIIVLSFFFLVESAFAGNGFYLLTKGEKVAQPSFCLSKDDYISTIKLIGKQSVDEKIYKESFFSCEAQRVSDTTVLQSDIKKETATSFWDNKELNRWLGFILGVAVTSLAVYGAGQLKQ